MPSTCRRLTSVEVVQLAHGSPVVIARERDEDGILPRIFRAPRRIPLHVNPLRWLQLPALRQQEHRRIPVRRRLIRRRRQRNRPLVAFKITVKPHDQRVHRPLLLVLRTPELFLTGYNVRPLSKLRDLAQVVPSPYHYDEKSVSKSALDVIASICIRYCIEVVIGIPEKAENDKVYNSALWMGRDGRIRHIYRKDHLWGSIERSVFDEYCGDQYVTVSCLGLNFGVLVCFDIEFVEPARILALKGCDCILVPTASSDLHLADSIVVSRAVENSIFVVYCNYPRPGFVGGSCCVAPDGSKLADAGRFEEALLFAVIEPAKHTYEKVRQRNNYLRDRRVELYADILQSKL